MTTDPTAWLAKARPLCEAVTPGPWEWWTSNSWRRLTPEDGRDGGVLCPTVSRSDGHPDLSVTEGNMAFIAAARTLLPEAITIIEHALAVIDGMKRNNIEVEQTLMDKVYRLQKELRTFRNYGACQEGKIDALQAENARLREALRFYADEASWDEAPDAGPPELCKWRSLATEEAGRLAREVLAEMESKDV